MRDPPSCHAPPSDYSASGSGWSLLAPLPSPSPLSSGYTASGSTMWLFFAGITNPIWWLITLWLVFVLLGSVVVTSLLYVSERSINLLLGALPPGPVPWGWPLLSRLPLQPRLVVDALWVGAASPCIAAPNFTYSWRAPMHQHAAHTRAPAHPCTPV